MKDEIHFTASDRHADIVRKVADWMDYYNNERPQWGLRKLTPTEYYMFTITGKYPLAIPMPAEKDADRNRLFSQPL